MEGFTCGTSSPLDNNNLRRKMNQQNDTGLELRKGPWTVEEDLKLIHFVSLRGEGRWNTIAKYSGLRRTGKSCRLRWLNYLRPDVKRGNITTEEQLLILQLHRRWGNKWSKIARHLPGRTDNEIKNFWRTRMKKRIDNGGDNNNAEWLPWFQSLTSNNNLLHNQIEEQNLISPPHLKHTAVANIEATENNGLHRNEEPSSSLTHDDDADNLNLQDNMQLPWPLPLCDDEEDYMRGWPNQWEIQQFLCCD